MRQRTIRRGVRLSSRSLLVAAAIVVLTATQADAVTTGHYNFAASGGASFAFQTGNNLVNGQVDDTLFYLSTTGSGLNRLPFALHLYNQTYQNIAISANGDIQPGVPTGGGVSGFNDYTNSCLPATAFGKPLLPVFWDDLFFDSNDPSHGFTEGVFVRTSGSAPNRKFLVSWQGHHINDSSGTVLAQVIFTEGSQTVRYVYLVGNGSNTNSTGASATIGIQSKQQLSSTQWSCNTANAVFSGLKLTGVHSG